MLLLISDANILIDIEHSNLTPVIFRLLYEIAVPDILFELELKQRHSHLLDAGLKIKSLNRKSIQKTESLTRLYRHQFLQHKIALKSCFPKTDSPARVVYPSCVGLSCDVFATLFHPHAAPCRAS